MGVCFASALGVVGQKQLYAVFLVSKLSEKNSILDFTYLSLGSFNPKFI